jgi:CheY-like chemotaxis protein/predicted transcriptional regulator
VQARRSFSVTVMTRILKVLLEGGPGINKTTLAGKTGLNYGTCVRYVDFLVFLGWVKTSEQHGGHVSLTESGKDYLQLLIQRADTGSMGIVRDSSILSQFGTTFSDQQVGSEMDDSKNPDPLIAAVGNHFAGKELSAGNVLLIEDEPDLLITYKVNLAESGFNVTSFTSPTSALSEFRKNIDLYDVVVSDIRMDSVNGLHLYKEIKSLRPRLRILFISALDAAPELTSVLPGFQQGDLMRKPVDRTTLVKNVTDAVNKSRYVMQQLEN